MSNCQQVRLELGAYALGALGGEDTRRVEDHLAGCAECAREAAELAGTASALALADLEAVESPPEPSPDLLPGLLARVRAERRRARRRRVLAGAAAAVAAAALAGLGGVTLSATEDPPAQPPVASVSGTSDGMGLAVRAWDREWGTAVEASVSGVPEGERCSLVAVGHDGSREVAATWVVPTSGYEGGRLSVDGGVGLRSDQVERFEVVTLEGDVLVSTG